jgi:hypothetical protein
MLDLEGGRVSAPNDELSDAEDFASFENLEETVLVLVRVCTDPGGLRSFINSVKACRDGSPELLLNQSGTACDLSLGCF